MKKFFILLIAFVLILGSALAELPDFSSMTFEELQTLKTAIEAEYNSRPEAELITLSSGAYLVGKDIKPGTYFAGMVYPGKDTDNASICVYPDMDALNSDNPMYRTKYLFHEILYLGNRPIEISLDENTVFAVMDNSIVLSSAHFAPEDYYTYVVPDGTMVPKGSYTVGSDIPSGTYRIYPGTISGGTYDHFGLVLNEDGTTSTESKTRYEYPSTVPVTEDATYDVVIFEEGDIFTVSKPVVLKKQAKLVFDD